MARNIERIAMEFAMQYERDHGENPIDRSNDKKGYDIESGKKIIEVKGRSGKIVSIVHFNQYNYASMQKALEENKEYWLYVVKINDDNSMILKKMNAVEVIKRAKVSHGYDIRLRKADFED